MILHLPLFCVFYDYNFRKGKANKFEFVDGFMKARLGDYIREYSVRNKINEDIPVYSVTNSQGFCKDYFGKEVASKDKSTYKIVPKGCFAYNPSRINVGSVDWQRNEERVIVSPLYNVFSVSSDLDNQYLYYFLKSDIALCLIKNIATGSVRDNLKLSMLYEFPINLPNIERQKEIVSTLDKLQSIITHLRIQLEKLDLLVKARFVEMFGDVINNTKRWKIYLFSEITISRLGKMLDKKSQTGKSKLPYLANFNVQWFQFKLDNLNMMDFNEKEQIEFSLEDDDLLVCEGGEIGRCAIWHNEITPCYFQKALHRVRCNKSIIIPIYLAWWFKFNCDNNGFSEIEEAKATIAHLPGAKLKKLPIAVPPLTLQNQFADFVKQVDKSKSILQQELDKAQMLFDSLMQEYFG